MRRRYGLLASLPFTALFPSSPNLYAEETILEAVEIKAEELNEVSPSDIPQGLSFSGTELLGAPGSGGDVLRSMDSLPGIAVNEDAGGGVAIRGSRPENNQYIVDFLPSGYLFHFTGNSVIDGDLVERFDLYPAGYGAEFQGTTGGLISVDTRPPKETFGGAIDISLIDAGLLLEGSPKKNHKAYLSTRMSYYDLLLKDVIDDDDEDAFDIVQLPKYFDYRSKYQIDLKNNKSLVFLLDGASDEAEFFLHDNADEVIQDPVLAGTIAIDRNFHRQGMIYQATTDNASAVKIGLANRFTGTHSSEGSAGSADINVQTTTLKGEYQPASNSISTKFGGTLERIYADYDVAFRDTGCTEFETDCRLSDADILEADRDLTVWQLQTFGEASFPIGDRALLTLGLGLNTEDYLEESHVEPRARLEYALDNNLTLSGSFGRYYEFPDFAQVEKTFGNPELSFFQSDHYVVGVEQELQDGWFWKAESYYKSFDDLVVGNDSSRYSNHGEGEAKGLELFVKKAMTQKWSGWLSLSYSEAKRTNTLTGDSFDFEYDQPVIASLVLKRKFSDKLSLGAKTRFHSGQPYTPVIGAELDEDNPGSYRAVYGSINSKRLPDYFRLDLRLDYQSKPGAVKFYGELINATNNSNISGYDYNANYSIREDVEQLPLFIFFGIRKEW